MRQQATSRSTHVRILHRLPKVNRPMVDKFGVSDDSVFPPGRQAPAVAAQPPSINPIVQAAAGASSARISWHIRVNEASTSRWNCPISSYEVSDNCQAIGMK